MHEIPADWPAKRRRSLPPATSQRITTFSLPPDARVSPSGLNTKAVTGPVCPWSRRRSTQVPAFTSNSTTVPSDVPQAITELPGPGARQV
jgi:hypothetical protein